MGFGHAEKVKSIKRDPDGEKGHDKAVWTLSCNTDVTLLVSAGVGRIIYVWDILKGFELKHKLSMHRKDVTCLKFRMNTNILYSASYDRSINVWDAHAGIWKESLIGPTEPVTSLDCLKTPTFVVGAMDKSVRFYKVETGKHSLFPKAHEANVDAVIMLNHQRWVSGGNDSNIRLWSPMKRKNISTYHNAHDKKWICSLARRP
eukprot:UN33871